MKAGTHLPDLTVITPVFQPDDDTKVLFYVASRGHHTDMYVSPPIAVPQIRFG